MQIGGGQQPEGQLAELEVERAATPERVEAARLLFEEATLDDFEPYGNRGKLRHRETGVVYTLAQEQVLMAQDPRKSGIAFFIVAGTRLLFLRPRGFDGNVELGIPGQIVGGQLQGTPDGGVRVVDVKSGAVVMERVRL
jgi:hypothetical protein